MNFRFVGYFGAALAAFALGRAAESPPTASADSSDLTALAAETAPSWDLSTTLRASSGWRENVAASPFTPVDRAFWRTEAESFLFRPLGPHWRAIGFLNADVLRYFSPPTGVSGEQQFVAHLEGRWLPNEFFRLSLKTVGFRQDAIVDPSSTEGGQLAPIWVRLDGGYATLTPRVTLPWHVTIEPALQIKRIDYRRNYNGDYNESRPGVRLEWKRTDAFALIASWRQAVRHYASLTQTHLSNRPIKGNPLLSLHQREGELRATSTFEAGGTWTLSALTSRMENRDRAMGFLDYNQKRAGLEVGWSRKTWRINLAGEARRQDYLQQQVGVGAVQTPRITDAFEATGRIEWDVAAKWTLFAENRWERSRSNIKDFDDTELFSYRTNTASLGVQRSF